MASEQPKRNPIDGWGTQNDLARYLGVSPTAVRKARKAGRISGPDRRPTHRGWYDLEKAKREWANNTVGQSPVKPELDDFRPIPWDPVADEPDWDVFPTNQRFPQRQAWLKGKDYEQRLEQRARVLVPRSRVRRALHDHARQRREEAFKIIPRLAQQLAKAKTAHEVEVILTGELTALFSEPIVEIDQVVEAAA